MLKYIEAITRKNKLIFGLLSLLFFVLIYLLNRIYPLYIDDWAYSLVWYDIMSKTTFAPPHVDSLSDIIFSQYNHYMRWGGRSVVHGIAQFLLVIPPSVKQVLNASVYLGYIYILYLYARKSKALHNEVYILLFLCVFLLLPIFHQTTLWTTGTANYLWGTFLLLLFLYPYYKYSSNNQANSESQLSKSVFIFLLGIVAGWTNENTAVAAVSTVGLYLLFLRTRHQVFPKWLILGFIGLSIGAIIMLMAPGNYVRLEYYTDHSTPTSPFTIVIRGLKNIYHIYKQSPITLLSLFCLIMYYVVNRFQRIDSKDKIFLIGLFLMAHLSIWVMITTPFFPLRATFFAVTLMIICSVKLWNILMFKYKYVINIVVIFGLSVLFINTYTYRYKFIAEFGDIMNRRIDFIESEKKRGNLNIIITEKIEFPQDFDSFDVSTDSTNWVNNLYRNYFHINYIKSDK